MSPNKSIDYSGQPSSRLPDFTGKYIGAGKYKMVKKIGQGSYGVVYLGQDMRTDPRKVVAIKCSVDGRSTSFRREIDLQLRACAATSGVLAVQEVIEDEDWDLTFLVTDYCGDGDLFDMAFAKFGFRDEERLRSVFLQILDALAACHNDGIFHRDLKPENILCKDGGDTVVITDFGFATTERATAQFGMGTEYYMSPEVHGGIHIKLSSYSSAHADIWALGGILFNLVTGEYPWRKAKMTDDHFFYYIMHNPDYLTAFNVSEELNDIFKCIFTANPRNRISLGELRLRILTVKTFRARPCISYDGTEYSMSSYGSLQLSSDFVQFISSQKAGGKGAEKNKYTKQALRLHELLTADVDRHADSADSVSFEAIREDSVNSTGNNNHISVGSQRWPSNGSNATRDVDNAPLMSSFLGGDDIDSITGVETMPARMKPTRAPLRVRNPSPPSCDVDSDSDYDSDEAITPETHAVDFTAKGAADIPELALDQPCSSPAVPAPDAAIETSILPPLARKHAAFNGMAASPPKLMRSNAIGATAQNMLAVSARRVRMREERNAKLGMAAKA